MPWTAVMQKPNGAPEMRRVLVIGSSGAGKSVFAARLAERTGLPLVHLDAIYWHPGWIKTPKDEWLRTVEGLLAGDAWILDGNYAGTLDRRLAACDTVFFLDLPRTVCLWRAVKRRFMYHRRSRPDMRARNDERVTRELVQWIWEYPAKRRPGVLAKLDALWPDQRAIILRSSAEIEAFLGTLPHAPQPSSPVTDEAVPER